MAEHIITKITKTGAEVAANAHTGGQIKFTRLAVGDGTATGNLDEYTALTREIHRFTIDGSGRDGNMFWASAQVDATGEPAGYALRELGLYAANPADPNNRDADILYAVSVAMPDGDLGFFAYMPAHEESTSVRYLITLRGVVSSTETVDVTVRHEVTGGDGVTQDELEKYTPLDMFQPLDRDGTWYGEHRHDESTIDGLAGTGWEVGDIRTTSYHLAEAPEGDYMLCDGREVDLADYPALFPLWDYGYIESGGSDGSDEGIWKLAETSPTITYYSHLRDVCWVPELEMFFAVGYYQSSSGLQLPSQQTWTSPDGKVWTAAIGSSGSSERTLDVICWSPELKLFAAAGQSFYYDFIYSSVNGTSFTGRLETNQSKYRAVKSICWSPELFLFVAVGGARHAFVYTSKGGGMWDLQYENTSEPGMTDVCWSAELGLFVAINENTLCTWTSSDGITWVMKEIPTPLEEETLDVEYTVYRLKSVCWSPELGLFVAAGNKYVKHETRYEYFGLFYTSANGITWTLREITKDAFRVTDMCWAPEAGMFVAMGWNDPRSSLGANYLIFYTSTDGITWKIWQMIKGEMAYGSICWSPELKVFAAVVEKSGGYIYSCQYFDGGLADRKTVIPNYNKEMPFTYLKVK